MSIGTAELGLKTADHMQDATAAKHTPRERGCQEASCKAMKWKIWQGMPTDAPQTFISQVSYLQNDYVTEIHTNKSEKQFKHHHCKSPASNAEFQ